MPPGRTWLVPVRLDDGDLPEWELGAGQTLSDLNYADLFGERHDANLVRLLATLVRLTGKRRASTATTLAALEQVGRAERGELVGRLTKEMLLDPTRRIELDELVSREVQQVVALLHDEERFGRHLNGSNDDLVVQLAEEAQELWELTKPFCTSLQVAARWGAPETLSPWSNGLRALVGAAQRRQSGTEALLIMRHVPGVLGLLTAALAASSAQQWANLKALVVDPTVADRYEAKPISLIEATDMDTPFANEVIANVVARSTRSGRSARETLEEMESRGASRFHAPAAEWLRDCLRPLFADQWPDDDAYDLEFDRAEVVLGVLAEDASSVRNGLSPEAGRPWPRSQWLGRSTWRVDHGHVSPVDVMLHDLKTQKATWAPLAGKLFGGDDERARTAVEHYGERFKTVASRRW